jgi:hypothetical protein
MNEWSTPGWSFYHRPLSAWPDLAPLVDRSHRRGWAAAEWLWPASTAEGWADHLYRTLSFGNCRQITIYNWTRMIDADATAQEGIRQFVARWPDDPTRQSAPLDGCGKSIN